MKPKYPLIKQWLAAAFAAFILFGAGEMMALDQGYVPPLTESARQNARNQIHALMLDKAQWSKPRQKIDSQLIFAAKVKSTGIVHANAPKLRPDVKAEADGRYKVQIKGTVTPALLAAVEAAGGKVILSFPNYNVIQALVPVDQIEVIAARDDVTFIQPPPKAQHNHIDSEGDYTHEAINARETYGASGAGITVGIISDSIDDGSNAYNNAVSSGNIDANNTFVIPGQEGTGEGEGLAMCEIIHDLAPDATIGFATGGNDDSQMASNIVALAEAGCDIIADDESFDDESPFQDGPIALAVQQVTAMGVVYLSCARNSGNLTDETSSTWESDFTNGGYTDVPNGFYEPEMEFGPGYLEDGILDYGYDFSAALFWDDPLDDSTNDYDLYMVDGYGDIIYSSENTQNGPGDDPYEYIPDTKQYSTGYYLVVCQYSGISRFMYMTFGRGALRFASTGCVKGHNGCDATNALSVAATPADTAYSATGSTGPYPNPFVASDVVEPFSADGPRIMFYNSDGTPITPNNLTITGGRIYRKPDLTAADGVSTTVPAIGGNSPFFGTSAATPHAAAIAALVWSYNPNLTPGQVCNILTNSCIRIMGTNVWSRNAGYGILMANLALANTPAAPAPSNQLVFTTQPEGGTAGTAWKVQPVVTLEDGSGNTVTGTAQNVTLSIQNNAGPGGTLSGNATVATVSGVATFSGLNIGTVGNGYTLTAIGNTVDTAPGTVVSGSFNITPASTPVAPTPSIALSGSTVILTWPTSQTGLTLQTTPTLGPLANWTTVSGVLVIGDENLVTITATGTQQYFRLSQ